MEVWRQEHRCGRKIVRKRGNGLGVSCILAVEVPAGHEGLRSARHWDFVASVFLIDEEVQAHGQA